MQDAIQNFGNWFLPMWLLIAPVVLVMLDAARAPGRSARPDTANMPRPGSGSASGNAAGLQPAYR